MKIKNFQINNLKEEELLAYETGLHLGDGSLQLDKKNKVYRVIYSGHSIDDRNFYEILVPKILKRLYKKEPCVYFRKNENTIVVHLNSKKTLERKINLGLPVGNKLKLKEIPSWIKGNLVNHFIRGLADADFTVSFKKNRKGVHNEPRIEFFTNNKILHKFTLKKLKQLGFRVSSEEAYQREFRDYRIRMYGKEMLNKWMKEIGFFNRKHLSKIILFEKFGYCPPHLTTKERMRLLFLPAVSFTVV